MESILRGLNVAQKAAVTSPASVLQILAPPGSGKTKTLTSRVAYLLAHHGFKPWNVICCTFTIKASREMRARLHGMIGGDLESRLVLGTFHSVCRRYLASYGHLIGIPKNFGIADSDDSLNIIKRAVKRLKLSIDPKTARSRISHRKARGKGLDELPKSTKTLEAQEFATICHEYEESLRASNLLDYDDLLVRCVQLLREHPECVSNIEALLIDEFQDTNIVQFELMKLLASAKRCVTIVGDPDQSIYGFRSAEIENLTRMRAYYPEAVVINLEENYRSSSAVLKLAQEVIEQDLNRPSKKLKSTHCYGTLPVLRRLPNPHEEALWIAAEIKRITAMTGNLIKHSDIAILLRSAFLSMLIEKALVNAAIPYRMVGGRRFFDRVQVRILLDYLRTISHPDNTSALLAVINTPARKVGDATVKELVRVAEERKESLWSVVQKVLDGQISLDKKLSKPAEAGLRDLVNLIRRAQTKMATMEPKSTPAKLIEHVVTSLNYQDYLKKQYQEDHEERWEDVKELLMQANDAALQFITVEDQLPQIQGVVQEQSQGPQDVLAQFLANIVLSTEKDNAEEADAKPRVTISTIHSAKGLEWPVVFVPAIYEGSIPHSRAEDTDEERRLLYVALTRAQALLYMTFPVMQSRDENESILTQFLPTKVNHMISQAGPMLGDKIVEDIATILRRSPPTQEDLARGVQSLKENESLFDDIWPIDGTHKRARDTQGEYPSFILQAGQSLSDALKPSGQRSHFTTSSYTASTTMSNSGSFSVSTASLGFITANSHLKHLPQPADQVREKPSMKRVSSDPTVRQTKKPSLVKSSSGQSSIASFFSNDMSKSSQEIQLPPRLDGDLEPASNGRASDFKPADIHVPPPMARANTIDIPSELLNRRLLNTGQMLKRPRPILEQTDSNNLNKRRTYHHYLSSSPTKEGFKADVKIESTHEPEHLDDVKLETSTSITSTFKPAPFTKSNISLTTTTDHMPRLGGLNTLQGFYSVSSALGISAPGNSQARKTLGVRRTMNGWDNRRNK